MDNDVVVAIDGPAGSGKSTVAHAVAARTGLRYLDTGSTYRALTLGMLREGVPVDDQLAVAAAAPEIRLALQLDPAPGPASRVLLDGEELRPEQLRSQAVNDAVSAVSAVPEVRERLVALQREAMANGGVVAEGRDVGATVWPTAEVKVFLTASAAERARRRAAPDPHPDVNAHPNGTDRRSGPADSGNGESAEAVARRDHRDSSRTTSPTRPGEGAVVIDTTDLPVEAVVDQILTLVEAARARAQAH
jgi:cytidylate kinase